MLGAGTQPAGVISLIEALPKGVRERIVLNHVISSTEVFSFTHLRGRPAKALASWLEPYDLIALLEKHFWKAKEESVQRYLSNRLHYLERELAGRAPA